MNLNSDIKKSNDLEKIKIICKRVKYFKKQAQDTECEARRVCYYNLFLDQVERMCKAFDRLISTQNNMREIKEFTKEELALYDGSQGKSAYVAIDGLVYDVSNIPSWGGASHFGLKAGNVLTDEYNSCHMGDVLSKLKVVGRLKPVDRLKPISGLK